MQINKVSIERVVELNQIIKRVLYYREKVDFDLMKLYTNEIYCIVNNLIELGYLEWNHVQESETIEYAFKFKNFLSGDFNANIFYLFPKNYEFQFKNDEFGKLTGDKYISILFDGISLYVEYFNSL